MPAFDPIIQNLLFNPQQQQARVSNLLNDGQDVNAQFVNNMPADISSKIGFQDDATITDAEDAAQVQEVEASPAEQPKKEDDTVGFWGGLANVAQKAGLVAATLAAAKGNTNPLELILATKVGRQRAKEQGMMLAQQKDAQEAKAELEKQKFELDRQKLQLDWFNAMKSGNPNLQYKEIGGQPYVFDPSTGNLKAAPGFESTARSTTKEIIESGVKWNQVTDKYGNVSLKPMEVVEPIEQNRSGETETVRWLDDKGQLRTETRLTDLGRRKLLIEEMKIANDQVRGFDNAMQQQDGIARGMEAENSYANLVALVDRLASGGQVGITEIAIINQFQRLIDPATVREGDVELLKMADSKMTRFYQDISRAVTQGDIVSKDVIVGMLEAASDMMNANRSYRKELVDSQLNIAKGISTEEGYRAMELSGEKYLTESINADVPLMKSKMFGYDSDEDIQQVVEIAERNRDIQTLLFQMNNGSILAERALQRIDPTLLED